eukprot:1695034-Amphidinium_carterae.1
MPLAQYTASRCSKRLVNAVTPWPPARAHGCRGRRQALCSYQGSNVGASPVRADDNKVIPSAPWPSPL